MPCLLLLGFVSRVVRAIFFVADTQGWVFRGSSVREGVLRAPRARACVQVEGGFVMIAFYK